jgi:hypothetical protein
MCSYIGSLAGEDARNSDPNCGCYEYQPFNGVFHRNSRIRTADITDGISSIIGVGEMSSTFVQTIWAGIVPNAETVYNWPLAKFRDTRLE